MDVQDLAKQTGRAITVDSAGRVYVVVAEGKTLQIVRYVWGELP